MWLNAFGRQASPGEPEEQLASSPSGEGNRRRNANLWSDTIWPERAGPSERLALPPGPGSVRALRRWRRDVRLTYTRRARRALVQGVRAPHLDSIDLLGTLLLEAMGCIAGAGNLRGT